MNAVMSRRRKRAHESERIACQRAVSKLMDEAPEWRDWFGRQLELLDLRYDAAHWLTTEKIRG